MSFEWAPFSEKQLDAIANSDARINALDGPVRSGKTISADVAWTDFIPKAPHKRLLMTGVTKDTLYRNVLADLFDIWGERNYKYNTAAGIITAFGKEIHVVGVNDIKALKKIQGMTIGGWYADEIVNYPFEVVKMAMTRLSPPGSRAYWTMNPDSPFHPIYTDYLTNPKLINPRPGRPPRLKRWQFRLTDNLSLDPDYIENLNDQFHGLFHDRFVKGLWVTAEGAVYDLFDPSVHIITRKQFAARFGTDRIPADWTRVRSVDFGYTNPFVCQWWAVSPDGEWFLYREIYYTRRLVEDHARQIISLSAGENIVKTYADHDAEDRATLHKYGVPTVPANKEIKPGIQTVYGLLSPKRLGRPQMYFLADALVEQDPALVAAKLPTCTVEEFGAYVWPKPGKDIPEIPVDANNHGMDAKRYATHSHLGKPPAISDTRTATLEELAGIEEEMDPAVARNIPPWLRQGRTPSE